MDIDKDTTASLSAVYAGLLTSLQSVLDSHMKSASDYKDIVADISAIHHILFECWDESLNLSPAKKASRTNISTLLQKCPFGLTAKELIDLLRMHNAPTVESRVLHDLTILMSGDEVATIGEYYRWAEHDPTV